MYILIYHSLDRRLNDRITRNSDLYFWWSMHWNPVINWMRTVMTVTMNTQSIPLCTIILEQESGFDCQLWMWVQKPEVNEIQVQSKGDPERRRTPICRWLQAPNVSALCIWFYIFGGFHSFGRNRENRLPEADQNQSEPFNRHSVTHRVCHSSSDSRPWMALFLYVFGSDQTDPISSHKPIARLRRSGICGEEQLDQHIGAAGDAGPLANGALHSRERSHSYRCGTRYEYHVHSGKNYILVRISLPSSFRVRRHTDTDILRHSVSYLQIHWNTYISMNNSEEIKESQLMVWSPKDLP